MSRLSIEISPKQHQLIKALAAMKGVSIKEFVMSKLFNGDENLVGAYQDFKELMTARIESAQSEEPSDKSLSDIVEEEIGQ